MMLLEVNILTFARYYTSFVIPSTILIPMGVAIFNYRYLNRDLKIVLFYLFISGGINLWGILKSSNNNLYILHIYTIVEFLILMAYFISITKVKAKKLLLVSKIIWVVFPIFSIVNRLFFQNEFEFNSNVRSIEALIFILYSIIYFYHSSEDDVNQSWGNVSLNWINSGFLIYFSSSIFMFSFANFITSTNLESQLLIVLLHNTFIALLYILMALGFYRCKKSTISTF